MTLAFIRHGQTDWNAQYRLQGSSDVPLNDTGRQQARDAVAGLADVEWHAIVSSPLSRARETASIIAAGLGLELGPAYDELVERHYGEAEGATDAVVAERWPEHDYPGLEPVDSVIERGTAALERVKADYGDRNTLIVCHGTIIRYTLSALAGRTFDQIRNGSVATFDRDGDGWRVHSVNDEPVGDVLAV
ncbi:MAG: histidine phosphatase family protein [Mycetocola sp.]